MAKIGILGAGTWGIALTRMLANEGHETMVWSALPREIDEYSATRRQPGRIFCCLRSRLFLCALRPELLPGLFRKGRS